MSDSIVLRLAPAAASGAFMAAAYTAVPFVNAVDSSESHTFQDALVLADSTTNRFMAELSVFLLASLGLFVLALIVQVVVASGRRFFGALTIFWTALVASLAALLLLRVGLGEMISSGASFGLAWTLAYVSFGILFADRIVLQRMIAAKAD